MKTRTSWAVGVAGALVAGGYAWAETPQQIIDRFRPDHRVWQLVGTVDRSGSAEKTDTRNEGRETYSYSRTVSENLTVKACGQAGRWTVTGATWSYSDISREDKVTVSKSTTCPPPPEAMEHNVLYRAKHFPPDIREPGDKITNTNMARTIRYAGNDAPDLVAGASGGLVELPGSGLAVLDVRAQGFLDVHESDVEEHERVCEGDVVRKESRTETSSIGSAVEVSKTPPSENGSTTTFTSYPPRPHLFGFTEKIPMPKGTGPAGGSKIIGEKKARHPGDYSETTVASWSLTPKDPCDDVRELIEQDLAWTEAYMDEAIRQQAKGDPQAMKKLVYKRVYKAGGGKGGGSGDADIEMKLDGKCKIVGDDEFKKKALEDCKPGIIVDTLLAHENRHVGQCKFAEENRAGEPGGRHSYFNPTPEEYGNNEGAAHLVGIRKALNWYEDNCKGDTSSMRARKAAMESKLEKRP